MALSRAEVSLQIESAFEVKLDPPPHPARMTAAATAAIALRLELAVIEREDGALGVGHDRDLRYADVDQPRVLGADRHRRSEDRDRGRPPRPHPRARSEQHTAEHPSPGHLG